MESTSEWKLPWPGECRCGRVQLRVTAPPLLTTACHCEGCQRMSSSAFSLTVGVPAAGFAVTAGEPVVGGMHADEASHMFCGWCMTWMFTVPKGQPFVNVRPSMLEGWRWFVPFMETYTSQKLPWVQTPAVHRFDAFPPIAQYPELLRDFAARGPRPT